MHHHDQAADCTNYTFEILYQDAPAALKQPAIQYTQIGQQAQLSVVAAGAPAIGYQWQKGGVNLTDGGRISGSTSNTLTLALTGTTDTGYYQLVMSNLCGLAASQPIPLIITAGSLTMSRSGSSLVLNWSDTSASLQTAPTLFGPWTTIAGAPDPYIFTPSGNVAWFRLIHP